MKIKSVISCIAVLMVSALLTGCAMNVYPGGPSIGGSIATSVRSTAQKLAVPMDANARCVKEGTSSASAVLGLFAFGDASVNTAMKNGGITKIHSVDHQVSSVLLGLWASDTIIVCGE